MPGEEATPLWRVGKADAGTKAVLHRRNFRVGALAQRQRLQPQRSAGIAFRLSGQLVEQVCWLAIVGPGQAGVDGQVLLDLPVVAEVQEGVILAEIQVWI